MIKTLLAQVKQYKSASILAPVFTAGEVLMEYNGSVVKTKI